eukprot:53005-Eustigmatos_ZCMA.PRE.1
MHEVPAGHDLTDARHAIHSIHQRLHVRDRLSGVTCLPMRQYPEQATKIGRIVCAVGDGGNLAEDPVGRQDLVDHL